MAVASAEEDEKLRTGTKIAVSALSMGWVQRCFCRESASTVTIKEKRCFVLGDDEHVIFQTEDEQGNEWYFFADDLYRISKDQEKTGSEPDGATIQGAGNEACGCTAFRERVYRFLEHRCFDHFILFVIFLNCIVMIIQKE
eukprot:SAG31_NODE_20675_length_568_cov_0.810235_1_plen_140_part_01